MKLLFLTNNTVSAPLIDWLQGRTELTVWEEKLSVQQLHQWHPELIVSYSYRHIIKPDVLAKCPNRFINLHISLLPYNRGTDPNAWSFLDNTPKGVSIHLIDEGIDTGPVLVQKEIALDENAVTLGRSYQLLQEHIQALFREHWEALRDGTLRAVPQAGAGTFHKASEFKAIKDRLLGEEGWDIPIPVFKERYRLLGQ